MIIINCQPSHCSPFLRLVFLMKQKSLDGSKCSRAVAPFNASAPPTPLLWQMVLAKKGGGCHCLEEGWRAGAALFSWTGAEHIQLLSTEPQQPSCNADSLCFCRGCWIRFCRGTTAERLTEAWWGEPGPCRPQNRPFHRSWFSCRCLSSRFTSASTCAPLKDKTWAILQNPRKSPVFWRLFQSRWRIKKKKAQKTRP